jgi:hypothetical protein
MKFMISHVHLRAWAGEGLRGAGQEVVIATGKPFLDKLPLPTVAGYPTDLELDWAIQESRRRRPDARSGIQPPATWFQRL